MKLLKIFKRKAQETKTQRFIAIINDNEYDFSTKEQMLAFVNHYAKENTIFSINLFRMELFNLTD